jgi:hypothetical protein
LPPLERTLSDLNDVIETETLAANRTASPPEPASLRAARRKVEEDAVLLRALEAEADEVLRKFTDGEPRSGWRRFFRPSHDPERQALEGRLQVLQGRVLKARGERAAPGYALKIEEKISGGQRPPSVRPEHAPRPARTPDHHRARCADADRKKAFVGAVGHGRPSAAGRKCPE